MRTKKSFRNITISMINSIINIIISLIAQKVFLNTLGESYLGLNGIFSNVLSILAVAELGIGTAIIYKMYKPIEESNKKYLSQLMNFYKKCYTIIIAVMVAIIFLILPFLKGILGDISVIKENVYILYLMFSLDIIISYMLSYKKSILFADQKEYISTLVHIGYLIIMNTLQIIFLIKTGQYIIYLLIKIFSRLIENIVVSVIVNKKYPYLKENKKEILKQEERKDITKRVKALFVHKIAGFVVTGTDTILISYFLGGLVTVGYYSNYMLIISSVTTVFNQVFISMTSSVGNLLVTETEKKKLEVFNKIQFLNFWIFSFASICLFCLIEPFITLWIGEKYLLSKFVLICLVLNFFMQGMRRTMMSFKEAAGIFYEDRIIPIIESIINLVASIIFLKIFGLPGVMLGTITSTLIVFLYSYPKYVYQKLFGKKGIYYIKEIAKYLIITVLILYATYTLTNFITVSNLYIKLIINAIICIVIPNIIIFILFFKNEYYKYYISLASNTYKRIINRIRR